MIVHVNLEIACATCTHIFIFEIYLANLFQLMYNKFICHIKY
jgi:hypothetical protein